MAPCTYIGLALGAALGGYIRFGSLEFAHVAEAPKLYGPRAPVIVLKTSDCCT